MKTNNKIIVSLFMLFLGLGLSAQNKIQFGYDKNGNRIQRKLIVTDNNENQRTASTPDTSKTVVANEHVIGVFPNPTQNMLNVNITHIETNELIDLFLSDEGGRSILTLKNQASTSVVNMENYKTGVYYLQVKVGNDKPSIYKIMKIE